MEMERPNLVRNWGLKLPIGYRFRPTDEELLVHYLKRKVHSLPFPASVIPEFDVFRINPWDLPPAGDELREKKYFFTRRKRKGNENTKCNRIAGCGYWKANGKEKHIIIAQGSNQILLGMKRRLVFYQGKRRSGERTNWVMREYRLLGSETTPTSTQKQVVKMEDWVVCCIYQKKRKVKVKKQGIKTRNMEILIRPNSMDFMVEDSSDHNLGPPPQPSSSSCSSGITDQTSSNGSDDQEASSAFLCFSSCS